MKKTPDFIFTTDNQQIKKKTELRLKGVSLSSIIYTIEIISSSDYQICFPIYNQGNLNLYL